MKVKIQRDDVLMSLDGVVYIEGKSGEKIAKALKTNRRAKRAAIGMLRTYVPDLTARQVTLDPQGRVRINHPKYAEVARVIAGDPRADGKAIGKVISHGRVVPPRELGGTLDFICPGDGTIDLFCGEWDFDRTGCDVNGFCGWS